MPIESHDELPSQARPGQSGGKEQQSSDMPFQTNQRRGASLFPKEQPQPAQLEPKQNQFSHITEGVKYTWTERKILDDSDAIAKPEIKLILSKLANTAAKAVNAIAIEENRQRSQLESDAQLLGKFLNRLVTNQGFQEINAGIPTTGDSLVLVVSLKNKQDENSWRELKFVDKTETTQKGSTRRVIKITARRLTRKPSKDTDRDRVRSPSRGSLGLEVSQSSKGNIFIRGIPIHLGKNLGLINFSGESITPEEFTQLSKAVRENATSLGSRR